MKIILSVPDKKATIVASNLIALADRDRFNEMEWTRPAEEADEKAAKIAKLEKSHKLLDAIRDKIQALTAHLHTLTEAAKVQQRKIIVALKKRANEIHAEFAFNKVPLYKVEASTSLSGSRPTEAEKKLARDIKLRTSYEKLHFATKTGRGPGGRHRQRSDAAVPKNKAKLNAWKVANPDYPRASLRTLNARMKKLVAKRAAADKKAVTKPARTPRNTVKKITVIRRGAATRTAAPVKRAAAPAPVAATPAKPGRLKAGDAATEKLLDAHAKYKKSSTYAAGEEFNAAAEKLGFLKPGHKTVDRYKLLGKIDNHKYTQELKAAGRKRRSKADITNELAGNMVGNRPERASR